MDKKEWDYNLNVCVSREVACQTFIMSNCYEHGGAWDVPTCHCTWPDHDMKKMLAMSMYDPNLRNRVMQEATTDAATVPATDGAATGGAAFEKTEEDKNV